MPVCYPLRLSLAHLSPRRHPLRSRRCAHRSSTFASSCACAGIDRLRSSFGLHSLVALIAGCLPNSLRSLAFHFASCSPRSCLVEIRHRSRMPILTCGSDWDQVRKAVCSAYFQNAGRMKTVAEYVNMRNGMPCHLHPSSSLFGMGVQPEYDHASYHPRTLISSPLSSSSPSPLLLLCSSSSPPLLLPTSSSALPLAGTSYTTSS